LIEAFHAHLAVSGDVLLQAGTLEGEVRELLVLWPDQMKAPVGGAGQSFDVSQSMSREPPFARSRVLGGRDLKSFDAGVQANGWRSAMAARFFFSDGEIG
jgi:hypothetical protein